VSQQSGRNPSQSDDLLRKSIEMAAKEFNWINDYKDKSVTEIEMRMVLTLFCFVLFCFIYFIYFILFPIYFLILFYFISYLFSFLPNTTPVQKNLVYFIYVILIMLKKSQKINNIYIEVKENTSTR
jgi:hypothetical protein